MLSGDSCHIFGRMDLFGYLCWPVSACVILGWFLYKDAVCNDPSNGNGDMKGSITGANSSF